MGNLMMNAEPTPPMFGEDPKPYDPAQDFNRPPDLNGMLINMAPQPQAAAPQPPNPAMQFNAPPDPAQPDAASAAPANPNPLLTPPPDGHQNFLQKLGSHLKDTLVSDTDMPMGYENSGLSREQIMALKPSWMSAHFRGENTPNATAQWAQNIDRVLARKAGISQYNTGQATQAQMLQNRADYLKANPYPTSGDPAENQQWLLKAAPHFLTDPEVMKSITPILDKMLTPGPAGLKADKWENDKGEFVYLNPSANTPIPAGYHPVQTAGSTTYDLYKRPDGTYEYIAKSDKSKVPSTYKLDTDARQGITVTTSNEHAALRDVGTQVAEFHKANSQIIKAATMYPGFEAAAHQALLGNPGAFKPFVTQMAPQIDPNVQLRLGTLMFVQKIDPSFTGDISRWLSEKASGSLPPNQVRAVMRVVKEVRDDSRKLYQDRYDDLVGEFPDAAKRAHSADYVFGKEAAAPAAAGGTDAGKSAVARANAAADAAYEKAHPAPAAGAPATKPPPVKPDTSGEQALWDQAVKEEGLAKVLKEYGTRP